MLSAFTQFSNTHLNEVAIADLRNFQLAVLTGSHPGNRGANFSDALRVKRVYQDQGWLIWNGEAIAHVSGLEIGALDAEPSPWTLPQRLAPSVPISFETHSCEPLPPQVSDRAVLKCQVPQTRLPYQVVFRSIAPRFVRIYPFDMRASLAARAAQMQIEEADFIAENREHLRQVPFYRMQFDL